MFEIFAWSVLALLTLVVFASWWIVSWVVANFVRKGILVVPFNRPLAAGAPKISIPAADVGTRAAEIEDAIIRPIPTGPLKWLVRTAYRWKTSSLLESLQDYCTTRQIEVVDQAVLAAWLHTHVAQMLGDIAGEIASGFFRWAFFILVAVGIFAAWWRIR